MRGWCTGRSAETCGWPGPRLSRRWCSSSSRSPLPGMAPDSRGPGAHAPSLLRGLPWILAALLMVPSLMWVYRDAGVWSFDPAWYWETSVELLYALAHNTGEWREAGRQRDQPSELSRQG